MRFLSAKYPWFSKCVCLFSPVSLSKWGFVCDCASCSSGQDDDLLTATARLEADIRRLVTSPGDNKDWARIAGWQDQVNTNKYA